MITEADQSFYSDVPTGGVKGMKAARTPALLGYRNAKTYALTQSEENYTKLKDFKTRCAFVKRSKKSCSLA